jgi:hypothetical protein
MGLKVMEMLKMHGLFNKWKLMNTLKMEGGGGGGGEGKKNIFNQNK